MSEQLYSIKESTLTDIGNALRRKYGDIEWIEPENNIFKTNNATGFGTVDGENLPNVGMATKTFEFDEEKDIKIGYWFTDIYVDMGYCIGDYDADNVIKLTKKQNSTYTEHIVRAKKITLYAYLNIAVVSFGYYSSISYSALNTFKSSEIAGAIETLDLIPEEAFMISGDCSYKFAYNGWNWFIEQYGDKISTKDISDAFSMFNGSTNLVSTPFEINFDSTSSYHNTSNMFQSCNNLVTLPKINAIKLYNMSNMFNSCYRLRVIPEDYADSFDWSYLESQTSPYTGQQSWIFCNCYSLRSFPISLINRGNPYIYYSYSYFYYGFDSCASLDELINLPIPYTKATWTSNAFSNTFGSCYRLKNATFALNNSVPYTVTWKSQVIDLSDYVGYVYSTYNILNYNSGITADKEVKDDATYQALKNDPDWFATNVSYSRYNHDSAVATINSLPDTSAYLATAGGTNTIKFKGQAGALTDGGAINTLTEEEIAVAAAKGWTVTLV